MRGTIVEIRKNTAAMLSDDGCIIKIENKNYEIGQGVEIKMKINFNVKKMAALASVACFLLVGGVMAYYTPATYVSLDVNPSIEYSLNIFDRVLTVKGVNDDGSKIIDEIKLDNLSNKTIDEAIAATVDKIAEAGYLESDGSNIVITTSAKDLKRASELAQELKEVADETCEEIDKEEVAVNAEAIGAERVSAARELGVTPGKLNLVEKLIESSEDPDSIDTKVWLGKSVKEIMAETKANKEKNPEIQDEEDDESTGTSVKTNGKAKANKIESSDSDEDESDVKPNNGKNKVVVSDVNSDSTKVVLEEDNDTEEDSDTEEQTEVKANNENKKTETEEEEITDEDQTPAKSNNGKGAGSGKKGN